MNEYILAAIIYSVVAASYCAAVAKSKNRNPASWFLGGLFFNLLALIAIAGIPVQSHQVDEHDSEEESVTKSTDPDSSIQWSCSCGLVNSIYMDCCRTCSQMKSELWECTYRIRGSNADCGHFNDSVFRHCERCAAPRPKQD